MSRICPPTPFADVLERVTLDPGEREAICEVLAKKESALESDVIVPDSKLANLLVDRYDSIASHSWRKNGTAGEVYAKLEQLFRDYVKEPVQCG